MHEVNIDTIAVVPRDTVIVGSSIGYRPFREGGTVRDGFLTADGPESITLKYPLSADVNEEGTSLTTPTIFGS